VVQHGKTGWLDEDLSIAMSQALEMDSNACRAYAEQFSWRHCSSRFLTLLQPLDADELAGSIEEREIGDLDLVTDPAPLNQSSRQTDQASV